MAPYLGWAETKMIVEHLVGAKVRYEKRTPQIRSLLLEHRASVGHLLELG